MIRAMLAMVAFSCLAQLPPPLPLDVPDVPQTVSVTLVWNPSYDTSVTGYNVYYGVASRVYTNRLDVMASTNATVDGLLIGARYYFAATAYNLIGLESDYSAEVSYQYVEPPPRPIVVTLVASILSAPSATGPWAMATNLTVITLTNPPTASLFWRPGPLTISARPL
jgi:hypothetical protein